MSKFNVNFQSSLPKLPGLKMEVKRLLRVLLGRFLQADVVRAKVDSLTEINFDNPSLQLPNESLGLSHKTWAYFYEIEDDLDNSTKASFFDGVKKFYKAIASTII